MPDKVKKFLKSLDSKTKVRIRQRLNMLKSSPLQGQDIKKLRGWGKEAYRLRIGKIRIIYRILKNDIEIIDIDYRGNVY